MVKMGFRISLFVAVAAMVIAASGSSANSADEKKILKIKEVMGANHKGDMSLFKKVNASLKEGKWEDASKAAATLAENAESLPKNVVRKGDADSWKALSKKYVENTKALADATEKKDADASKAASELIGKSCNTCHNAHKGAK